MNSRMVSSERRGNYKRRRFVLIKETFSQMKVGLLYRALSEDKTSRGDLTTLTLSSVINGQALNYFSLSSHVPSLY